MNSNFDFQLEKLKALAPIVKAANNEETTALMKFLLERIKNPDSFVVFLGETSSGKSSLINGMIKEQILPVSAKPTTGTITEIMFVEDGEIKFYKFDNSANLTQLSKEDFQRLSWNPDKNLNRLRAKVPANNSFSNGVRLFDTPGYNSIVESHEEVLKDFIPNSDAVIYTIGYKIGIQNEDYVFMRYIRELLGPNVPVVIAVNRCPEGVNPASKRIKEIKKYASDILGIAPKLFLIPQVEITDEDEVAMPYSPELLMEINTTLNSEARNKQLKENFDGFIQELFNKCNNIIKGRLAKAKLSEKEINDIKEANYNYSKKILRAVPDLIEPAFNKLIAAIPSKIEEAKNNVVEIAENHIEEADRLQKDEEVAFLNSHLLPFQTKKQGKECVQNYIEVELNDLNARVDDYIQKETVEFSNKINIVLESNTDIATKNLLKQMLGESAKSSLTAYFLKFGGMGGANAGVANAASHLLKQMGDFVGKTFTRETHNALKHTLSKIGATSMKRLGGAIAVVIELLMAGIDLARWKGVARNKVGKAMDTWEKDTTPTVITDLKKLKEENIKTLEKIAKSSLEGFQDEKPLYDMATIIHDAKMADEWEKKYGLN